MKHTIELNGKHYDALSGELLTPVQTNKQTVTAPIEKTHSITTPARPAKPHKKVHAVAKHRGKPARTLMRTTVKKPVISHKPLSHHSVHTPFATIAKIHTDASRLARISKIQKSHLISKFGT